MAAATTTDRPDDGNREEHGREHAPHAGFLQADETKCHPDHGADDEADHHAGQQEPFDLPIDFGEDFDVSFLLDSVGTMRMSLRL